MWYANAAHGAHVLQPRKFQWDVIVKPVSEEMRNPLLMQSLECRVHVPDQYKLVLSHAGVDAGSQ